MCPVISLSETIVRTARSDRGKCVAMHVLKYTYDLFIAGGRTFFIANTSTLLKAAQLYEFQAETSHVKEMCVYFISFSALAMNSRDLRI